MSANMLKLAGMKDSYAVFHAGLVQACASTFSFTSACRQSANLSLMRDRLAISPSRFGAKQLTYLLHLITRVPSVVQILVQYTIHGRAAFCSRAAVARALDRVLSLTLCRKLAQCTYS